MCNLQRFQKSLDDLRTLFGGRFEEIGFPEGVPNFRQGDVRITESSPILRRGQTGLEVVQRRWSWPGPTGKPVFNYQADGRRFPSGRCLILSDGFYEFTDPPEGSPRSAKKSRWLFTLPGHELFGIAGFARPWNDTEAWTMLTIPPGPDIAPFHNRQIVPLTLDDGLRWLDPATRENEVLRPYPAGTLKVEAA